MLEVHFADKTRSIDAPDKAHGTPFAEKKVKPKSNGFVGLKRRKS